MNASRLLVPALAIAAVSLSLTTSRAAPKEPLTQFFKQLAALEGQRSTTVARIAWYGDSAIVSDGYTGALRARLQERFGDAGPGFILAGTTFDGYLRAGVRLKRQGWESSSVMSGNVDSGRYGYGGIVSTSYGGATATFEVQGEPITAVEVWYQGAPKGGKLQLFVDGAGTPSETHSTERADKGDDVWRVTLDKPARSVKVRAGGEGLVRVYGVALERAGGGVQLDALGILGMRARRWLNADETHLAGQVKTRAPDVVVLNFGGNERVDPNLDQASHEADLDKTLDALKAGAPGAACIIMGPIAHGEDKSGKMTLDPALDEIYQAQRAVAEARGCAFFDTIAAMGGKKKALDAWRKKKLLSGDYAHLTNKGHDALGSLLAEWLLERYDAWRKHQG